MKTVKFTASYQNYIKGDIAGFDSDVADDLVNNKKVAEVYTPPDDEKIINEDEALTAREAAVAKKEAELSSQDKALAARETAVAKKEAELSSQDKALAARETAVAKKEAELSAQDKALAAREAAVAKKGAGDNALPTQGQK